MREFRAKYVIVSIFIQLCLGLTYIWSVFQIGIAEYLFGSDNALAGLAFSLSLGMLGVGSAVGGYLQDKFGPRPIIILGGACLTLGFYLSSYVTPESPKLIYITYGIIGGFGMGSTYATDIAVCQKWFPDKRGLVTGTIVAALGMGGVAFTPLAEYLISTLGGGVAGVGELRAMAYLSVIILVVIIVGAAVLKNPDKDYLPPNFQPKSKLVKTDYTVKQALQTKTFYLIASTFFLACMAGLMMIAFAKPIAIAKGISPSIAAAAVMIIAIFNAFGRLFWGTVSDKIGRKKVILIITISTAVATILVNFATGYLIFILIGFIGFFYGGLLGVFPALTADNFGTKNIGVIYGLIMMAFGFGAVTASYIAGYFKNIASQDISLMLPAFIITSLAALCATAIISFLKPADR